MGLEVLCLHNCEEQWRSLESRRDREEQRSSLKRFCREEQRLLTRRRCSGGTKICSSTEKGREEQRSSLTCVFTVVVTETECPLSVSSHKPNLLTGEGRREQKQPQTQIGATVATGQRYTKWNKSPTHTRVKRVNRR